MILVIRHSRHYFVSWGCCYVVTIIGTNTVCERNCRTLLTHRTGRLCRQIWGCQVPSGIWNVYWRCVNFFWRWWVSKKCHDGIGSRTTYKITWCRKIALIIAVLCFWKHTFEDQTLFCWSSLPPYLPISRETTDSWSIRTKIAVVPVQRRFGSMSIWYGIRAN
jgi:hypothetical protein